MKLNKPVKLAFLVASSLMLSRSALANLESELNEIKDSIVTIQKTFVPKEKLKTDSQDLHYLSSGTAAVTELKALSKRFDALMVNQNYAAEWEPYIQKEGLYIWPHQTAKQAVGGHFFYPQEIVEWVEDAIYMDYHLGRKDILWSFAIASRYEDPRGKLYLASTLYEIWRNSNFKEAPQYYSELHKQVNSKLAPSNATLEVLYILGLGHSFKDFFPFNLSKAEDYYKQILTSSMEATDRLKAKAEIQLLRMKATYRKAYESIEAPKAQEFKKVAEKYNKGRALFIASNFADNEQEQEALLTEAIERYHCLPAYIKRGKLNAVKNPTLAKQDFEHSGKEGLTIGFIKAGALLLDLGEVKPDKKALIALLRKYSSQEEVQKRINSASSYFEEALDRGDLEAAHYLMKLHEAWYDLVKEKSSLTPFRLAVEKGLQLGTVGAYERIICFPNKQKQEKLKQLHGKAPHKDLWQDMKAFIESK